MVNDVFKNIIQKSELITFENCHKDEQGLYVCNVCGRRKQTIVPNLGVVNCICNCEIAEREEEERKSKEHLERMRFKQRQQTIEAGYRDIYLADSDVDLVPARNYVENFAELKKENIGLMLWGTVGNGKTFMASCIANELCKKGYRVMMLHITEALRKIAQFDNQWFCDELASCDLLILDDFGVSRNTDYQLEQLNMLIDMRYASKKPLIITTNLTRGELDKSNDIRLERTFNRLIEMTQSIHIEGESRRKKASQERYQRINDLLFKQ